MSDQGKKGIFGKFSIGKGINETEELEQKVVTKATIEENTIEENLGTIRDTTLPIKVGFWQKFRNFWLQDIDWNREIKVVLTPKQQKIEDEINEFLHQEITWEKVHDFLFQEVKFGKK